ncbi:MAG: hypothetical protein ACREFY_14835 [Acetobacteraceae bacterium]
MLEIETFDARAGGNVIYKALAHPLAAEAIARLYADIEGPVALYDPDGLAAPLLAMYSALPGPVSLFVHDVAAVGETRGGLIARPLTDLARAAARSVLVTAFDAARACARIAPLLPPGATLRSLDEVKLPPALLTNPGRYLDRLNFATNFAFFRDQDGLATRLVSANYWAGYGAGPIRLWLRLFDAAGTPLATWEQDLPPGPGGFSIDSSAVRARFGLGEFTGQLFLHAIGAAGHDVVKYALDTYAADGGASLSCTHDANAWPSDRYAGLPAPQPGERVVLWLQNSHAAPIPADAVSFDRMGTDRPTPLGRAVGPFATVAVDVASLLPGLAWPAQIELRTGRHMVRPRYEVTRAGRTRIAHVNVERADLRPDPAIAALPPSLGRGFLLAFPVLDPVLFRTFVQPTPMAVTQADLPVRLDLFDAAGQPVAQRFLGRLARDHALAVDLDTIPELRAGHAELVYDFRNGGGADGWLHALFRWEHRASGHAAESSFGAHIFNTLMTWRDEPQSYSGPPPGLTTRLFLRLGAPGRRSFAVLIYPASAPRFAPWSARSSTALVLHDAAGRPIGEEQLAIARSGSAVVRPEAVFGAAALERAGTDGYVLVRDGTCRLFGYHGLADDAGGFSLDHMFGF